MAHVKTQILTPLLLALLAVGCKPTENNYRDAYTVALQKQHAENQDADIHGDGFIAQDAPDKRVVDGDTISYYVDYVKVISPSDGVARPLNMAVSKYKMRTNAIAQAADLAEAGYNSMVIENADEAYYVVAVSDTTINEAVASMKAFMKKNPKYLYRGLPETPVFVIPTEYRSSAFK